MPHDIPLSEVTPWGVVLNSAKHPNAPHAKSPPHETGESVRLPQNATGPSSSPLERLNLLILLGLIPLRAFINETHAFELPRQFRNLSAVSGPMPGVTFCIIAVIGTVSLLVACNRLWRGTWRYRPTGAEWGVMILLTAAGISTYHAGQKHLAIIGVADLLAAILYMIALRQLLVRPWQVRLALTVVLATGGALATKCLYQKYSEIPATIEYYEQFYRQTLFAGDSPQADGRAYDFRQRLLSAAATGYFAHANVLGSYLILVLLSAAAMFVDATRRKTAIAWRIPMLLIAVGCAVSLRWTQSKGAIAACGIALITWAIGSVLCRKRRNVALDKSRGRWAAILIWLAFGAIAAAVAGRLWLNPAGLGRSMQFRWMYWEGAARMLSAEGPWGVGAENFGRLFTRFKSVDCPEEVQSPHSWIVQMIVEWGVIGFVGLLLLFAGFTRVVLSKSKNLDASPPANASPSIINWAGGIGAMLLLAWSILLRDAPAGYLYLTLFVGVVPWMIAFAAASGAMLDSPQPTFSNLPLGPIIAPLAAGLFGFLLHTGIDLAFFWSGPATLFFGLMAILIAAAEPDATDHPPKRPRRAAAATVLGIGGAAIILFVYVIAYPASVAGRAIESARNVPAQSAWKEPQLTQATQAYQSAIDAYPLDATAAVEWMDAAFPFANSPRRLDALIPLILNVRQHDSRDDAADQFTARLFWQRFSLTQDPFDLLLAIDAMESVVYAYPTSPMTHLHLAQLCEAYAAAGPDSATGEETFQASAAFHYRVALWLDSQRVFISPLHHIPPQECQEIELRIDALGG